MSFENLSEGKLPFNFHKSKKVKKLGIILEENNINNSEFEKSGKNSSKISNKKNISFSNHSVNIKSILFNIKNDIEKDDSIKYKTQKSFFDKKFFYDILNEDKNNIILNSNKKNNKHKPEKMIRLNDSGKKPSELIKLISNKNSDKIKNENYTKNINLNININNNIQYEIEKKEKNNDKEENDNSDLNKSLNSLIKIAEKNCLNLNESVNSSVYTKNRPVLNGKMKENKAEIIKKENEKQNNFSTLDNNKSNNREMFGLSLINLKKINDNKRQIFKRVKSQNIIKNKKNEKNNNIREINLIKNFNENGNKNNDINCENNNANNDEKKNNLYNNNIYNKKNSSRKYNSIKNKNRSFNLNKKKDKYNHIKNYFSIDKKKNIKIEKKIVPNYNKYENNINNKEGELSYHNSLEKNNNNYIYNYTNNQSKNKKFGQKNGFFEVNISLNNYLKNENSMEESNYKVYKRPTRIYNPKNITRKGKSVDKLNNNNILNIDEENPFTKRIKPKKKLINRAKTNNIIYLKDSKERNPITYKKKNHYIQDKDNNYNSNYNIYNNNKKVNNIINNSFNANNYLVTKRKYNEKIMKQRNSINNCEIKNKIQIENYNIKKYNDIYEITNNNKNIYNNKKNIFSLNLEDLMVLEEKLCEIIIEFKQKKKADNQCFDFWNYYFNFSLYEKIEKIFKNETEEEIVRLSLNYKLMSILICYEFSLKKYLKSNYLLIIEILQLCHRNLTLIYEEILNKISSKSINNIWVIKLSEIVQYAKNSSDQIFSDENYFTSSISKINFNINSLIKKIKNIIYNNDLENKNILLEFVKNLNQKTYEEIDDFFREYIYKVDNFEGSILSSIINNNIEFSSRVGTPYIKEPNLKRYTLVLDLNETLINFKSTKGNQGLVRTRPFLFEFLDSVSQFFEVILFTCSTQNYTDSIVKAIEYKKKYFDYIFCRQHTTIIKNDFVKDLTRIGRSLDSIIIIDNMPQNFRLQKENGIYIKSFWGDNSEDTALYDLIPILINIAKEKDDVREQLKIFREEIVKKITSNISKNNI